MQETVECGADNSNQQPMRLTQQIGQTTYKVNVHFSKTSKETISDKVIRIIEKEAAKL